MPAHGSGRPIASVIGLPVIVGESICGVHASSSTGARAVPTPARDNELLRIFAAYMSSSIQNALDAIRAAPWLAWDHLTGLFNSRLFPHSIGGRDRATLTTTPPICRCCSRPRPFQEVNDAYGHLAGSWTLREVARLLSENATTCGGVGSLWGR